jgi:hypothetical protein
MREHVTDFADAGEFELSEDHVGGKGFRNEC